jgi:TP901 family phage tail tape measure protein
MGFAGQVFAARVAIGLAVPSPKALNKTGSMLAQGVKGIHRRIKMAAKEAGLTEEYRKNLAKLNQGTRNATVRTSNFIATKLQQNLDKMSKASIRNTRKVYKKGTEEYKNLTKQMEKPFKQRHKDMFKTPTGMISMAQMAERMAKMNKKERLEQLRQQNAIVGQTKRLIDREKERLRVGKKKGILDREEQKKLRRAIAQEEKILKTEKHRLATLKQIDGELNAINKEMDDMEEEGTDIGAQFTGVANTLRTNFNDALRNTVAIMTAFGFQIHRAATSLMEFERELINANSVFNLTHDNLFSVGNEIMKFGNQYGIAVQNGAEGMYQLASAGVTAEEAMTILPETLKLSMAVQGDHNTISKLTAQTLFGFGMEMDQVAEVTDKFAFAIQKSLIEYQDLASAVKFALPFFTSTGQSIDQLLGALQILTNRALEAGIAGRGLRQALAEFAESAMDSEAGFRKMGVEILNAEGEMLQLTEIAAQFASAVGPETASNTELLTTLIEELNVRGATAFVHLVQASDEFTQAVEDTTNAGGQLDAMIEEQNKSLSAQVQILKTNVLSIFAFRDAAYEGTEFINGFHEALVNGVQGLRDIIIEGEGAEMQLTETGKAIQDLAIDGVEVFVDVAQQMISIIQDLAEQNIDWKETLRLLLMPLKIVLGIVEALPDGMLELYIKFKLINSIIPITTALSWGLSSALKSVALYSAASMIAKPGVMTGVMGVKGTPIKGALLSGGGLSAAGKKALARGGTVMTAGGVRAGAGVGMRAAMLGMGASVGVPLLALGAGYMAYKHFAKDKAAGGYITPMASGGFPSGGSPYLVGEQGPELFMPNGAGQILNKGQTDSIMDGNIVLKDVTIGVDSFGGLQ